jgi:hypothetical protein
MRFCGDSLSEVSNCSLNLCKSGDSRRILASALIYAYPLLKDSAPCLCTLFCALYHGAGTFNTCWLMRMAPIVPVMQLPPQKLRMNSSSSLLITHKAMDYSGRLRLDLLC